MTALAWVLFGLALATVLDPAGRAWVARGVSFLAGCDSEADELHRQLVADVQNHYEERAATLGMVGDHDPPPSEGPRPTNDYGEKRRPAPNQTKPYIRRM